MNDSDNKKWVYCGVFIDNATASYLDAILKLNEIVPEGWKKYLHHMTLAFNNKTGGSQYIFDHYKGQFGKLIPMEVESIGVSDKAIAFGIKYSGLCQNDRPHVTAYVSPDGKPVDSNKITEWEKIDSNPITFFGRIGYFDGKNVVYGNE